MARRKRSSKGALRHFERKVARIKCLMFAIILSGVGVITIASKASAQEFCGPPNQRFEFEMSQRQQQLLLSKVASIPMGAAPAQAVAVLGKPDDDSILESKQAPARFIDHELAWYVARVDKDSVNNRDKYVVLHFSKDGALTRMTYNCLKAATDN